MKEVSLLIRPALSTPSMEVGSLVGLPWETLFASEKTLPTILDANRLPCRDMAVFGRCPETDPVLIVVCKVCSKLVLAPAMATHMQRHGSPALDLNNLVNSSWDLLFPNVNNQLPIQLPETNLNSQSLKDKIVLGHVPEKDAFSTIKCTICYKWVMPQAIPQHLLKHDANIDNLKINIAKQNTSLIDVKGLDGKNRNNSAVRRNFVKPQDSEFVVKPISIASLKVKIIKKSSPPKKTPIPILTDESIRKKPTVIPIISDELVRKISKKKCKSPVPPMLEPILPTFKKTILLNGPPPELSPINLPKKSSKIIERKIERIYDPDKNCGVLNDGGKPCLRSILCKAHLVSQKRAVVNRSTSYDALVKQNKLPPLPLVKPVCLPSPPPTLAPVESFDQVYDEIVEPIEKKHKTDDEPILINTKERHAILRWNNNAAICATPTPPITLIDDFAWRPSNPRPIATNTFGCRLVGGLMTKCKKLEAFRQQVQSVLSFQSTAQSLDTNLSQKRKRQSSDDELMEDLIEPKQFNGVSHSHLAPKTHMNFVQLNYC